MVWSVVKICKDSMAGPGISFFISFRSIQLLFNFGTCPDSKSRPKQSGYTVTGQSLNAAAAGSDTPAHRSGSSQTVSGLASP